MASLMKHNDEERRQWVLHDVALYNWKRSTRLPMREFIRQNRCDIDRHIDDVMSNEKPAYLAYGTIK